MAVVFALKGRPVGFLLPEEIVSWLAPLNFFTPIVGVLTLGCVQHVCSQWLPLAARPSGVVRPRPLGRCGLPRVRDLCYPRHRRRWGGRRRCFWLRRSGCAVWPSALFVIVAGGQRSPGGRRRKVPSMHPLPHARGIGVVLLQCKYSYVRRQQPRVWRDIVCAPMLPVLRACYTLDDGCGGAAKQGGVVDVRIAMPAA